MTIGVRSLRPDRRCRLRLRRPAFIDPISGVTSAGLVGAPHVKVRDPAFGILVLVDEVAPQAWHLPKAHRIGVVALLSSGEIAPDFVLQGATLSQKTLVSRRALTDIAPQPGLEHSPQMRPCATVAIPPSPDRQKEPRLNGVERRGQCLRLKPDAVTVE